MTRRSSLRRSVLPALCALAQAAVVSAYAMPTARLSLPVDRFSIADSPKVLDDVTADIVAAMEEKVGYQADHTLAEDIRRQVAEAAASLERPRLVAETEDDKDAYNFYACGFASGGLPIPNAGPNIGGGVAGYLCAEFMRIRQDGTRWVSPQAAYYLYFPKVGFTGRADNPKGTAASITFGGGLFIVSFDEGTKFLGSYVCGNVSAPLFRRMGFSGFLCGKGADADRPHLGFVGGMWGREAGVHVKAGEVTFGKF